jgi:hypothetical protein
MIAKHFVNTALGVKYPTLPHPWCIPNETVLKGLRFQPELGFSFSFCSSCFNVTGGKV